MMAITSSLLKPRRSIPGIAPEALVVDTRRTRPLWFDGQFVTAEVFNQEQAYVLTRQADLGLVLGKGVVEGLHVTQAEDSNTALRVSPGQGIGGGGETVALHEPLRIDLADLPLQRSLNQALGITQTLAPPAESRGGLFVLAASPLEFTSNPVGTYPTTLDGERRLEDSVINEAVLFSLVPYALAGNLLDPDQRRALAARRIFADGGEPELPGPALALALLELAGNAIVWLDPDLVRRVAGPREAGPRNSDGFGLAPESRRAAHLRQYQAQVDELVQAHPGAAFPARGRFQVLPAMGRLPAPTVAFRVPPGGGAAVLSQVWFPPAMPVDLAPIPEDELPALLEDSLLLPPIDLDADAATQANTPVTVFVPVPRADFEQVVTTLGGDTLRLPPPAPLGVAPSSPRDLLLSLLGAETPQAPPPAVDEAAWQALLAGRTWLWYARRRQLAVRDDIVGQASPFRTPDQILQPGDGDPPVPPDDLTPRVRANLERFGLDQRFARLLDDAEATAAGRRRLTELLDRQGTRGGLVLDGVLAEAAALPRLDGNAARGLESRYADPQVVAALARYEGGALGVASEVLLLGPGEDAEATVGFVRDVTGLDVAPATELVRKAPSVLPVELADAQDRLKLVFKGEDNGVPLGLRPLKPDSDLTVQLRGLLAGSRLTPELGSWLLKAESARRLEGLSKLSEQVGQGTESERLAETIKSLVEELP